MDVLCTFKIKIESQNFKGVSKSNEHIQIKIKMPYPSQEPPAYSKPLDKDLKGMDVIGTFKIKIESRIQNLRELKISDHISINTKMPNPNQEYQASSNAQNQALKNMDVLCTFKVKIDSRNWDHGCIKEQ